ncbi:HTTM domain-containing protein [Halorubrum sp. DTA98]|uniref:HTTM domain-containing protein n=1 Tax=Halorubrum sp. DTA98 TaxID=3402163 RepID=UPI003AAAC558
MSLPSTGRTTAARLLGAARERVRIDARSLALFRVLAGALIVADVLLRSRNLVFFYTDDGVVPTSLAIAAEPAAAYSIHTLAATPAATAALFGATALVGGALAIGYYTRLVTPLAFLLVVSLDLRNPFVLSFADTLFAALLFLAVFLPLGERWSVDAVASDRPRRDSVAGVATALVLAQMVTMYLVNGYHKTASERWWSGEAAVLILGIDEMTLPLGDALRASPTLLQVGGLVWFGMLLGSWLLVALRDRPRHLLVASFAVAHLSMALTVRIGAFAYVCLAGLTLFVQPSAWRDARSLRRRLTLMPVGGSRLARLRAGAVAVAERAPRPTPSVRRHRSVDLTRRNVAVAVGVVALVGLGAVASLSALGVVDEDSPQSELSTGATALVEFQTDWSIFAPHPRTTDRYYVFSARTTDGDLIDVRNDRELTYDRPADRLQTQHATYRERFYMGSLRRVDGDVADRLAEHVCETYETDEGASLTHVNMYAVTEQITRETIDDHAGRERSVSRISMHGCGDAAPTAIDPPEE